MEKNRSLVSKDTEFRKLIADERKKLFAKEEELFALLEEYVALKASIRSFYSGVYLPFLGSYIETLEKLKDDLLGVNRPPEPENKPEPPKDISPENEKEIKTLYRKLARLYHPDRSNPEDEEEVFFNKRMTEVNEAFEKRDLETLKRLFRKADAELGLGMSPGERLRRLKDEIEIAAKMAELYQARKEGLKKNEIRILMSKPEKERKMAMEKAKERFLSEIRAYRSMASRLKGGQSVS